jgi:hypothetical protein
MLLWCVTGLMKNFQVVGLADVDLLTGQHGHSATMVQRLRDCFNNEGQFLSY